MDNYKICSMTYALIPVDNKETLVIEKNKELVIKKSLKKIIDFNCMIYGSSYEGRLSSSKLLLNLNNNLPIMIEESKKIIILPTSSTRNKKCCWILFNNIIDYYKIANTTIVIFKNNKKLVFDITISNFEKQIFKINKLLLKINSKKL